MPAGTCVLARFAHRSFTVRTNYWIELLQVQLPGARHIIIDRRHRFSGHSELVSSETYVYQIVDPGLLHSIALENIPRRAYHRKPRPFRGPCADYHFSTTPVHVRTLATTVLIYQHPIWTDHDWTFGIQPSLPKLRTSPRLSVRARDLARWSQMQRTEARPEENETFELRSQG